MRLARFNIQTERFKHFVGLPIPASGGTIAAVVHFFVAPIENPLAAGAMVALVFLLSFLMISKVRYSSLKYLTLGRKSHLTVLAIALLVALIWNYSRWTLLIIAVTYTLSGPLNRLYSYLRHKKPQQEVRLSDAIEGH
jgi:CDP-diacylglycerol--serine O-phosphatidyltransferase